MTQGHVGATGEAVLDPTLTECACSAGKGAGAGEMDASLRLKSGGKRFRKAVVSSLSESLRETHLRHPFRLRLTRVSAKDLLEIE